MLAVIALIMFFGTLLAFALIGWMIGGRQPGSAHIRGAGRGYYDEPPHPAREERADLSHRGRGKEASKSWGQP